MTTSPPILARGSSGALSRASADAAEPSLADLLRQAMRGMANSVVIVTAGDGVSRHAMSATAVAPVSMDPPSMLFCVNREASSYPTLLRGAGFCLNFLSDDHEVLARECSGQLKGDARFESGAFEIDEFGVPYLPTATASISCRQDGRYLYGTHAIVIGQVREVRLRATASSLLYLGGRYVALDTESGRPIGATTV